VSSLERPAEGPPRVFLSLTFPWRPAQEAFVASLMNASPAQHSLALPPPDAPRPGRGGFPEYGLPREDDQPASVWGYLDRGGVPSPTAALVRYGGS